MLMVMGEDDDLAGHDLDGVPMRDLRSQVPLGDVVVKHEVLGAFKHRAAVLPANLRMAATLKRWWVAYSVHHLRIAQAMDREIPRRPLAIPLRRTGRLLPPTSRPFGRDRGCP
jgi:hypothetical protein